MDGRGSISGRRDSSLRHPLSYEMVTRGKLKDFVQNVNVSFQPAFFILEENILLQYIRVSVHMSVSHY
jgi:hypothetical protein